MRHFRSILSLSALATAVAYPGVGRTPARAAPPEGISLMQTLSGWRYPGASMPVGARMGDGGNPLMPSVVCQAVLTTPDSIDKVIGFYENKTGVDRPTGGARGESKAPEAVVVSSQDDSRGRPVAIRILVVNGPGTSTTLVISRADGEKETHIAWSHHIRLGEKR